MSKKENEHNEEESDFDYEDGENHDDENKESDKSKESDNKEKPKETKEARIARMRREVERFDRQNGKKSNNKDDNDEDDEDDKPNRKSKKSKEETGLDRVDRMVLRAEGIKSPEEMELVEQLMEETGKPVEELIETKYFKNELKAFREDRQSQDAIPDPKKRGGNAPKDEVEYWLAKGVLPPIDQPALRQKVVNAKIAREKGKTQFSDTPIVD